MDEAPIGTSLQTAVVVSSVSEEYAWVRDHVPGAVLARQSLIEFENRHYDELVVWVAETAEERTFYFDVSSFFGKDKEPGPPCPHCGGLLRTPKAKQCRHCGASWHGREEANR